MSLAKGLRKLKDEPEPVQPARHSWLWRQSRVMKSWEQRWYCLDPASGFIHAKSPQGLALAKPVFHADSLVVEATAEQTVLTKAAAMMWGFTVSTEGGSSSTLYSEDRAVRDAWVRTITSAAKSRCTPQLLPDRFKINYTSPLGSGLFAVVLRADDLITQMPVAIKVIKSEAYREYKDLIDREVMVWHAVGSPGHPNIVRLHEVVFSKQRVYFVAELLSGGNLVARLAEAGSYTEADAARITRQLLEALRHCHAHGIVHMDLKPENVVMANKSADSPIKLIDFSLSSFFHTSTEPGGTPEFVAPELLNEPEVFAEKGCGPAIDTWAMGILLFYLLSGRTPFQADKVEDIIAQVKTGAWSFTPRRIWAGVSDQAKSLITAMLQDDPKDRPSAADLLRHAWLQQSSHPPGQLLFALQGFRALNNASNPQSQNVRSSWIHRSVGVMRATHESGPLAFSTDNLDQGAPQLLSPGAVAATKGAPSSFTHSHSWQDPITLNMGMALTQPSMGVGFTGAAMPHLTPLQHSGQLTLPQHCGHSHPALNSMGFETVWPEGGADAPLRSTNYARASTSEMTSMEVHARARRASDYMALVQAQSLMQLQLTQQQSHQTQQQNQLQNQLQNHPQNQQQHQQQQQNQQQQQPQQQNQRQNQQQQQQPQNQQQHQQRQYHPSQQHPRLLPRQSASWTQLSNWATADTAQYWQSQNPDPSAVGAPTGSTMHDRAGSLSQVPTDRHSPFWSFDTGPHATPLPRPPPVVFHPPYQASDPGVLGFGQAALSGGQGSGQSSHANSVSLPVVARSAQLAMLQAQLAALQEKQQQRQQAQQAGVRSPPTRSRSSLPWN